LIFGEIFCKVQTLVLALKITALRVLYRCAN
jgi:hypothetical protein